MRHYLAGYSNSRGQMKIQQMAFVLVALVIFFALVAVAYVAISSRSLEKNAESIREERIRESIKKLAGTPEFSWTIDDCASCIDVDKVIVLKERDNYEIFWGTPFLQIKRVYPVLSGIGNKDVECTLQNYPECNTITIISGDEDFITKETFVALCRYEENGKYSKCEMGKIIMGVKL